MNIEDIFKDAVLCNEDVELGEVVAYVLWFFQNIHRSKMYQRYEQEQNLDQFLISFCIALVSGLTAKFEVEAKA